MNYIIQGITGKRFNLDIPLFRQLSAQRSLDIPTTMINSPLTFQIALRMNFRRFVSESFILFISPNTVVSFFNSLPVLELQVLNKNVFIMLQETIATVLSAVDDE